jgi:hypothetical protein
MVAVRDLWNGVAIGFGHGIPPNTRREGIAYRLQLESEIKFIADTGDAAVKLPLLLLCWEQVIVQNTARKLNICASDACFFLIVPVDVEEELVTDCQLLVTAIINDPDG